MPIWNGRESFSGPIVERNRLGPGLHQQPQDDKTAADEAKLVVADSSPAGVSCSHDSAVTLDLVESGQSSGGGVDDQRQLTNSKKFAVMADEPLTELVMVITEDNSVNSTITTTTTATSPATSKSYLRRLGDYLNKRRLKSVSAEDYPEKQLHLQRKDAEELSNVIFGDNVVVDKVMEKKKPKQGNFVIRADDGLATTTVSSASTIQDLTSDISDVEMDVRVGVEDERIDGIGAKAPKASSGYLLPRVFLNKEGTTVRDQDDRRRQPEQQQQQKLQPSFKLHQNGETSPNSVSNSGSERDGADNKSSGYCSSNLYSSGSIEEPIYSEPLPVVVTDIVPRIISGAAPDLPHVIDVDTQKGLVATIGHNQKKKLLNLQSIKQPDRCVLESTSGHSSNYSNSPSDKLTITDESENVFEEGEEEDELSAGGRSFGVVVTEVELEDDDEIQYEPPLVHRANDSALIKRLSPPHLKSRPTTTTMVKTFSFNGHQNTAPAPPPPPPPPPPLPDGLGKVQVQGKYSPPSLTTTTSPPPTTTASNENGLRRASASSSRKLPTIMEGIDGQIPRPIWPCDMDDSLMDINFESFLYSNEKRETSSPTTGGQKQQQQRRRTPPHRRCDSPRYERGSGNNNEGIGGARFTNDIENNYRCMKYLNSCPENPYLVEGVEDLQMSVDKSLALYLKKCDDSLTMQNTREFLEDIRAKLNVLLENHAQHSQVQLMRAKTDETGNMGIVYEKSVALIERQIEKLKFDLDSYLRLFNQPNELQIKKLCTGLAKDARIQTLQNAIENRNNSSLRNRSSLRSDSMTSSAIPIHDPTISLVNRLPFSTEIAVDDGGDDHADDNELNNYETMRDPQRQWQLQQPQNVKIISQYPENDLSSYFDTVYVQDGFNMGYKVNSHSRNSTGFDYEGSVVLRRGKNDAPLLHNNNPINYRHLRPGSNVSLLSQAPQKQARSSDSNLNSIASSADPNFRLKRNPSLSLSIASHNYSDRHPILASRDYERSSQEFVSTEEDSLNGSHKYTISTDSLDSHRHRPNKEGHLHQNMILQQNRLQGNKSTEEARKSIASVDRQDLIQEWHKNRPSIWELYYGINRPKQSMMGKKTAASISLMAKSGKKKKAAIPYPSTRPESDFTLDVPRSEQLQLKMKKDKQFRNRCRIITSFLSLIFFLLTVMVVSLVLTRGKRMFGSMI